MNPETELSSGLQDDIVWRIRELSELVRATQDGNILRQQALRRSLVPILYAHWEGYFVHSANLYLSYLTKKHVRLSDMKPNFWMLTVKKRVRHQQIASDELFSRFLIALRTEPDKMFKRGSFERINGKSNLRSDVLTSCCTSLGLQISRFEEHFTFIDKSLSDKRNFVAHGESLHFPQDDIHLWRDKVVELMRLTQAEIENAANRKLYLC